MQDFVSKWVKMLESCLRRVFLLHVPFRRFFHIFTYMNRERRKISPRVVDDISFALRVVGASIGRTLASSNRKNSLVARSDTKAK